VVPVASIVNIDALNYGVLEVSLGLIVDTRRQEELRVVARLGGFREDASRLTGRRLRGSTEGGSHRFGLLLLSRDPIKGDAHLTPADVQLIGNL
jgi:hypothetical protein